MAALLRTLALEISDDSDLAEKPDDWIQVENTLVIANNPVVESAEFAFKVCYITYCAQAL